MEEYNGEERRKSIVLDGDAKNMIIEMHTILTDKDMGICKQVSKLNSAVYGNGKIGLKTHAVILYLILFILGSESPIIGKLIKFFK